MTKLRGRTKPSRYPLVRAKHTGKLVAHTHTHYPFLAVLLVAAAVAVGIFSQQAGAALSGSGDYGVNGVVPAKKLGAPTITAPGGGAVSQVPTSVNGSCTPGGLVKIFKNEVLAGAGLCPNSGRYNIPIDLFYGQNQLVARQYNANEEASADSNGVSVSYAPAGINVSAGVAQFADSSPIANQLSLTAPVFRKGSFPGEKMTWPITLVGGSAPYAISVGWGDGKTDVYSISKPGQFDISHTYDSAGGFNGSRDVVIKATDTAGQKAYLQLISIVNTGHGSGAAQAVTSAGLKIAWPLLGGAALVVASFWLGERWEKRSLIRRPA